MGSFDPLTALYPNMGPSPWKALAMGPAPESQPAPAPKPIRNPARAPIIEDEVKDLERQFAESQRSSQAARRQDMDRMRETARLAQDTPVQTDLSPLLALVDSETGSKLSAGYEKPMGLQDRQATAQQFDDAARKMRQGMSDADRELLKTKYGMYQDRRKNEREDLQLKIEQEKLGIMRAKALAPKAAKPPTNEQFKAGEFARRLEQSEQIFDKLDQSGWSRSDSMTRGSDYLPGELQSQEYRSNEQAERNFVNAVLRRESGAAISPKEFASAEQQYFPRPGDKPEVLNQKKANRMQVFAGLRAASGGAYDQIPLVNAGGIKSAKDMTDEELTRELGE